MYTAVNTSLVFVSILLEKDVELSIIGIGIIGIYKCMLLASLKNASTTQDIHIHECLHNIWNIMKPNFQFWLRINYF